MYIAEKRCKRVKYEIDFSIMKKIAFSLLAPIGAVMVVNAGASQAIPVTIYGVDYDLSYSSSTLDDFIGLYGNPPSVFPWFGDAVEADVLATFVNSQFGQTQLYNDPVLGDLNIAPIFAFSGTAFSAWDVDSGALLSNQPFTSTQIFDFAVATRVPDPVPAPLPLFGAAAAFSASRRLRKRMVSKTFSL
jgi:hypothetical protein